MLSEKKVYDMLKRKIRLHVKTDNEMFLRQAETIGDILEISQQEFDDLFDEVIVETDKN